MIKIYVNDGYLDDFDMHNKAGLLHRTVALRRKRKRSSGFCPSYECITLTGSAPMYSSKLFNSRNQSIKTFPRRPDLFSRVHYRYSEEFLVLKRRFLRFLIDTFTIWLFHGKGILNVSSWAIPCQLSFSPFQYETPCNIKKFFRADF